MEQVLINRTKNYLVLKIPLKSMEEGRALVSKREKAAILEGLNALKERQTSKLFDSAKEAISFLRSL